MYRVIHNKLTTDDNVQKLKVNLSSICYCCRDHKQETINHLFCDSQAAKQVWSYYGNTCGINVRYGDIKQIVMCWWMHKFENNVHKTTLQCPPIIICWELWKSRCKARFENILMTSKFIIQQTYKYMHLLLTTTWPKLVLPANWIDMYNMIERLVQATNS